MKSPYSYAKLPWLLPRHVGEQKIENTGRGSSLTIGHSSTHARGVVRSWTDSTMCSRGQDVYFRVNNRPRVDAIGQRCSAWDGYENAGSCERSTLVS